MNIAEYCSQNSYPSGASTLLLVKEVCWAARKVIQYTFCIIRKVLLTYFLEIFR